MADPNGFLTPASKDLLELVKTLLLPLVLWIAHEMRGLTINMTKLLEWKENHQRSADQMYEQIMQDINTIRHDSGEVARELRQTMNGHDR